MFSVINKILIILVNLFKDLDFCEPILFVHASTFFKVIQMLINAID